jgi:antitoxin ParD1/3/4
MNISLTKSLEEFVREQVTSGLYHSASEVVRAGLRSLREKEADINEKLSISLSEIEDGKYSEVNNEFWDKLANEVVSEIETKNK